MADEPKTPAPEDAIIDARRAKAERVRARGGEPVRERRRAAPRRRDAATSRACARSPTRRATPRAATTRRGCARSRAASVVHVRGRVIALRSTGGLSFLRLRDRTGEIQLLVSEATLGADYARLDDIDVGDIVEAEGPLDGEQARRAVDRAAARSAC